MPSSGSRSPAESCGWCWPAPGLGGREGMHKSRMGEINTVKQDNGAPNIFLGLSTLLRRVGIASVARSASEIFSYESPVQKSQDETV